MMDEYNSGCFRFHWLQIKRQINLEVMHSLNTRDLKAAYKQADEKKLDNRRVLVDVERGRTVPNWRPRRLGSGLETTRIGGMTSIKSILGGRGKDLMKGEESESGRNLVSVFMTDQGIVIIGARKRSSHFELVAFIERALERISSGHSESDGGHNASMDLQHGKLSSESVGDSMLFEYEADLGTSKQLMDILQKYIHFDRASGIFGHPQLSKRELLHFVNSGGMEQLYIIIHDVQNSHAITLLVLEVVEQATRHSIGCEGFLGWWPCEDESIPSGTSVV